MKTMNYLRDNKQKTTPSHKKRARGVAVFLVLSTLLFLAVPFFSKVLHQYEVHVADAWYEVSRLPGDFFEQPRDVRARNAVLQQSQDIITLNENYSSQLVVSSDRCQGCQYGRITRYPQKYLYNRYMISLGLQQGVQVGHYVLVDGLYALGQVAETGNGYAYVQAIMDNEVTSSVYHRETKAHYEMIGKGNGVAEIHIPREITMTEGQWLYHATIDSIVMGYVEHVIFDDRDPFQTIFVRTAFRESHVKTIAVMTDEAHNRSLQEIGAPQTSIELIEVVESNNDQDAQTIDIESRSQSSLVEDSVDDPQNPVIIP